MLFSTRNPCSLCLSAFTTTTGYGTFNDELFVRVAITVKVRPTMQFTKIFQAAEVSGSSPSFTPWIWCALFIPEKVRERAWFVLCINPYPRARSTEKSKPSFLLGSWRSTYLYDAGTFRFTYDGKRVNAEDTPGEVSSFITIQSCGLIRILR